MSVEANKAVVRCLFEDVFPARNLAAVGDLVAHDVVDHDPLPGQPAGVEGIRYVVETLHNAHLDLWFDVDDLFAEGDRVAVRWTLRGTNTGSMLGRPPSGGPVEERAIVVFRLAGGKIAERWAAFRR